MNMQMLKVKINELTVSDSNLSYPGSISLPEELLKIAGIKPFEQVHVNNKTNGHRIVTYAVMNGEKGVVTLNGDASRHFQKGDVIHVLAYTLVSETEAEWFKPKLVVTDAKNRVIGSGPYLFA